MNYVGLLYGKIGRSIIPLQLTSTDIDRMEERLASATPATVVAFDRINKTITLQFAEMPSGALGEEWQVTTKESTK